MWFYTDKIALCSDVSSAEWFSSGLKSWSWNTPDQYPSIAAFVPEVFESYARILHPVSDSSSGGGPPYLTWKSVAEKNGKTIHPTVQYEYIDGITRAPGDKRPWVTNPRDGTLESEHLHALMDELAKFTLPDEKCWFGLWQGWGGLTPGSAVHFGRGGANRMAGESTDQAKLHERYATAPRVKTSGRDYILFSGDLSGADAFIEFPEGQSMSIWWPDSRSWFVATEVDFRYTYVGGSEECVAALLENPVLETLRVDAGDRVDMLSDTINC